MTVSVVQFLTTSLHKDFEQLSTRTCFLLPFSTVTGSEKSSWICSLGDFGRGRGFLCVVGKLGCRFSPTRKHVTLSRASRSRSWVLFGRCTFFFIFATFVAEARSPWVTWITHSLMLCEMTNLSLTKMRPQDTRKPSWNSLLEAGIWWGLPSRRACLRKLSSGSLSVSSIHFRKLMSVRSAKYKIQEYVVVMSFSLSSMPPICRIVMLCVRTTADFLYVTLGAREDCLIFLLFS